MTAAGDRILRVNTVPPYALHMEFQAGPDPELEERTWEYNVLYTRRLKIPVLSTLILLRSFAKQHALTGRFQVLGMAGESIHEFHYNILRVWETPPEVFLEGGIGLLPLATVAKVSRTDLPMIVEAVNERLDRERKPSEAELLRTATYVLMGLKHPKYLVEKLMSRNVLELSSTYQGLIQEGLDRGLRQGLEQGLEQGAAREARSIILRQGRKRFGPPAPETIAILEAISSREALERLSERLLDVETWSELLAE